MINFKLFPSLVISIMLISSCSSPKNKEHEIKFFTGSTENKIEVLDWGGDGDALIFLAGLGNSAHVFDEFAPRFTDKYHVYAITRRGFGASAASTGYDLKTLTADIIHIMDSLQIKKAILAGHSVAGEEISKFAVLFPDRLNKVIYLDAAFDRMALPALMTDMPEIPKPTKEDSASIEGLQRYTVANMGIKMNAEEIKQTTIFSKEGRILRDVTPDSVMMAVMMSSEAPEYAKIKTPALAIYAVHDSVQQTLPFYSKLDSVNRGKAERMFTRFHKFSAEQRERFKKEVAGGITKEIKGANHALFISHPDETEKLMREFLQ